MPIDPLRVYVLWAASEPGAKDDPGYRLASSLHRQLDVVGMIRDGIGFRIPVFQRSRRWRPTPNPRPIDLTAARRNVIIVVIDDVMRVRANWNTYLEGITQQLDAPGRDGADLLLPVIVSFGDNPPALGMRQGIVALAPENSPLAWESWLRRITMYAMGAIWAHERTARLRQQGTLPDKGVLPRQMQVFLSHAKKDGEGAARLLERFKDLSPSKEKDKGKVNVNSIEMFFDAVSTVSGEDYDKQFKEAIRNGVMLGILTDAYHGRPWCMWEVLSAKECMSPILFWDLSHRGTLRSFPYLGNVPVVRTPDVKYASGSATAEDELDVDSISDPEIERILLALLSEAMRMEVWTAHADAVVKESDKLGSKPMVTARPPELVDLARSAAGVTAIVYPDPPISLYEQKLLNDAFRGVQLLPLSEVMR
jgi:hypothetical protein